MVFIVDVDVATARPPGPHAVVRVVVEGRNELDAELAACHPFVVMPVGSQVVAAL